MKNNKKTLIVTLIITLLPVVIGLILWDKLPERMPIHWNAQGEVDGYSSKVFAVFGLPVIIFVVQIIEYLCLLLDPKNEGVNNVIKNMTLWIIPVVSVVCGLVIYTTAFGINIDVGITMISLLGVMFVIIGNYLPKCKQNYTIGIKIPWTLDDEDNWNKTHRFAGYLWILGGIGFIIIGICGQLSYVKWIVIAMVIIPVLYSGILYYKKNKR